MANKGYIPYLILSDYYVGTLPNIFNQIVSNVSVRQQSEATAQSQIRSYLLSRYDIDNEITPTLPYVPNQQYYANSRVVVTPDTWVAGKLYNTNDIATYNNVVYSCGTQNSDSVFMPTKWSAICNYGDMFYIPLPYPLFQLNPLNVRNGSQDGVYSLNDIVYWQGHTYQCLSQTPDINQEFNIQFYNTRDIPALNVFPNDPVIGGRYWKDLGAYLPDITATPGLDLWVKGDNRDQLLVRCMTVLSRFYLATRLVPTQFPETWREEFKMSVEWLKEVRDGKVTVDIQDWQPKQGRRVRMVAQPKMHNGY